MSLLLITGLLASLAFTPPAATALCTCARPPAAEEARRQTDTVFLSVVTGIRDLLGKGAGPRRTGSRTCVDLLRVVVTGRAERIKRPESIVARSPTAEAISSDSA